MGFLKLDVELHELFFILSILGCLLYELTVARIRSLFCKFEWKCSIAGMFKLEIVLAKKSLKEEQISSSVDMTLLFSTTLLFSFFDTFCIKWANNSLPKCPVISNFYRIERVKIWFSSGFEKFFAKVPLSFLVCSVSFRFIFQ